jgi:hypothetical protein
VSFGNNILLDG